MNYYLNQDLGDSLPLPLLVTDRLQQAPEEGVRIALYILKTGRAVQNEICTALGLEEKVVAGALHFWAGAGLLNWQESPAPAVAPRRRLTLGQVGYAAQNSPDIAGLVNTAQKLLGEPLSPTDTSILVTLHMEDGLPVELILAALAHFSAVGKRSLRYLERRLLSLARDGVDTLDAFEIYLRAEEQKAEHAALVAALLGEEKESFTTAQLNTICLWYDVYGYDDAMVEQAVLRCGVNRTVKYVNGILRNWYKTKVRTPADIPDVAANIAAVTTTPAQDDFVAQKGFSVPTLKR
ncbi:DnaD domain protein [Ruminococcaceae bacterium OttesenSCG-928-N02]|nr:DnaD domain protein [Ruminococcaceae bacterium OttesenSCG-928-N02]